VGVANDAVEAANALDRTLDAYSLGRRKIAAVPARALVEAIDGLAAADQAAWTDALLELDAGRPRAAPKANTRIVMPGPCRRSHRGK
jgi:hypothetical protein